MATLQPLQPTPVGAEAPASHSVPQSTPLERCPISWDTLHPSDTFAASDGHRYSRAALKRWLLSHDTSPLRPDLTLRADFPRLWRPDVVRRAERCAKLEAVLFGLPAPLDEASARDYTKFKIHGDVFMAMACFSQLAQAAAAGQMRLTQRDGPTSEGILLGVIVVVALSYCGLSSAARLALYYNYAHPPGLIERRVRVLTPEESERVGLDARPPA